MLLLLVCYHLAAESFRMISDSASAADFLCSVAFVLTVFPGKSSKAEWLYTRLNRVWFILGRPSTMRKLGS